MKLKHTPLLQEHDVLLCPFCLAEYSATAGDYWNLPDTHEFTCSSCGEAMQVATVETVYTTRKQPATVGDLE